MFQPETEDMLPRMAPKPSADVPIGVSEGIIRPQVPEVSILFGQQDKNLQQQLLNVGAQQHQQNDNFPQQTYAAWKKQMLPKVSYPAAGNMTGMQLQDKNVLENDYRTNLYPLRSISNVHLNIASNEYLNGFGGTHDGVSSNPLTYRRSLESCNNNMLYQQIHLPALPALQTPMANMNPLTSQLPNTNTSNVLTICAGTQTDASLDSPNNNLQNTKSAPWSHLASKKDVEDIRQILDEVKVEQRRILKMLETVLFSPHQQLGLKSQCRDIGVQTHSTESDDASVNGNGIAFNHDQHILPKNKFLQHLKPPNNNLQTPKGKPVAQSTTYRPNSPQSQRLQYDLAEVASAPTYRQVPNKPTPIIPKSASDTSLAMNELALKYLPNKKLAELLNELNMDCALPQITSNFPSVAAINTPNTPVKGNIDRLEKGPSDMSNASYKYLKKYRLLPEDHGVNVNNNGAVEGDLENVNENQMPQYNSPQQCNNIRNIPFNQRHIPTNKCSQYVGRFPLSPLDRASSPPAQSKQFQNLVNLENIKDQPKFL